MPQPTSKEVRRQFIDYFVQKCGHTFVPSSPCVPLDDPTLMFTNAGMNQFKDVFLATGSRPYSRAANTQKCIRAGGKHNDLDDVGHDTYHHTFFEMLGNWSFGDYFKKEAIEWAWELLTKVWGIDGTRLHATYFEGDASESLEPDNEARELWLKILPPERVHPGNKKDNFWEMGDTGPCGPCSEIHIDLTPDKSGAHLVNAGDARAIEIWNLVFIQFNRGADGTLTPLPAKHVDTGMGFERLCAVLQKVGGNYDTDVFTPIFEAIQKRCGAPAYARTLEGPGKDDPQIMIDVTYRVIADHLRCLTFALTDGAVPDNEGRGYVLRRILRRAVRYGRQYLNMREPFLCDLIPTVVATMGEAFPELKKSPDRVAALIREEEQSFIKTLDRGIQLFDDAAQYAVAHHHGRISGEDAFKLHDTYGFPIDLTELMAIERGLTVNIGEYERLMDQARERARAAGKNVSQMTLDVEGELPPTDDQPKYKGLAAEAKVLGFVHNNKWRSSGSIPADGEVGIVLDRTCAYAEQGGQIGDSGRMAWNGGRFDFEAAHLLGSTVVHIGHIAEGVLNVGDAVKVEVNPIRSATMKNHTVTHMMNWAMREVLGDHVQQKGSLVDPEKTRFDLSHHTQVTDGQLAEIEDLVNKMIERDLPVHTKVVPQEQARQINTLRAVFGEKYPDEVRVVSIGAAVDDLLANPTNPEWMQYSVEFCGGTHLKRTSEVKRFRFIEESAVAKGVRRVIGITGERAMTAELNATNAFRMLKEAGEADEVALPRRITEITAFMNEVDLPIVDKMRMREDLAKLQDRAKKAQKQAAKAGAADIMAKAEEMLAAAPRVGETAIIVGDMGEASMDQLRAACDSLRQRAGSAAVLLATRHEGKVMLLAAVTPDAAGKGAKAGDLIKTIAPIVGGKGGGRPDMAQGGGPDVSKLPDALSQAQAWLQEKLG